MPFCLIGVLFSFGIRVREFNKNKPSDNFFLPSPAMTRKVFYHYPCTDGIFAALVASLHLTGPEKIEYTGHSTFATEAKITDLLDSLEPEDTLYLLDYCGRPGFIGEACKKAKKVILLDHHKTAVEMTQEMEIAGRIPVNFEKVVDQQKSGATIAWDYFSQLAEEDRSRKRVKVDDESASTDIEGIKHKLSLVEDYDIWRFSLEDSKAFNCGFTALDLELDFNKNPSIFSTLLSLKTEDLISHGNLLIEQRAAAIAEVVKGRFVMSFSGMHDGEKADSFTFYGVESNNYKILSDVGHALSTISKESGMDPVGCVCQEIDGRMKLSLRSAGDFDTTVLSRRFGGGGHRNASGFVVTKEEYQKCLSV